MINLGKETVSQNFPTTIAFDIKILINSNRERYLGPCQISLIERFAKII